MDVIDKGGMPLLQLFDYSLLSLLQSVYPRYDWIPWQFKVLPHGIWKDEQNIRKYFEWLAPKLNIKRYDDWYRVPTNQLNQSLLVQHGGKVNYLYIYQSCFGTSIASLIT